MTESDTMRLTPCGKCGEIKKFSEFKKGTRKDGTHTYCIICWRAYIRERYAKNPSREIARILDQRLMAGPQMALILRDRMRKHRKNNKDLYLKTRRKWILQNPDKRNNYDHNKRIKRLGFIGGDKITSSEWETIKYKYGFKCAYCQKKNVVLTKDHIVPLSKGGRHIAENIAPACKSCNSTKHARPAHVFMQDKFGKLL